MRIAQAHDGAHLCQRFPSEEAAFIASMKLFQMVSDVAPWARCLNVRIENILGTAHIEVLGIPVTTYKLLFLG